MCAERCVQKTGQAQHPAVARLNMSRFPDTSLSPPHPADVLGWAAQSRIVPDLLPIRGLFVTKSAELACLSLLGKPVRVGLDVGSRRAPERTRKTTTKGIAPMAPPDIPLPSASLIVQPKRLEARWFHVASPRLREAL